MWRRTGRGESTLLPWQGARAGHFSREGAELRKRPRPLSSSICQPAPPPRLGLLFCLETAANRQRNPPPHAATSRSEIPSPTADPQADYTHGVQIHKHHYGQRTPLYMHDGVAAFITIIHRLSGTDPKPTRNTIIASDPARLPAYNCELITSSTHARSPHLLHRNGEPFRRNLL